MMAPREQCTFCGRTDGNDSSGIAINAIGCTGSCLYWAIENICDPPKFNGFFWEDYDMDDEEVNCIKLICSDVNPYGYAMLSFMPWYRTGRTGITLEDKIGKLYDKYKRFCLLSSATTDLKQALEPIYDSLRILHCQLQESPTLVLTVKVVRCTDETLQATTSTMSGNIICQETLSRWSYLGHHVTSVKQQLALPFRVANDCNLYTHKEFVAYYGEESAEAFWGWADGLYKSRRVFVCEDGHAVREWRALKPTSAEHLCAITARTMHRTCAEDHNSCVARP